MRLGSAFSLTICGSARVVVRGGGMGAQIRPLVWLVDE